jgi:GT2 family glycosyltransferase
MSEETRRERAPGAAASDQQGSPGGVEYASWLGKGVLLLILDLDTCGEASPDVSMLQDGNRIAVDSRAISYRSPEPTGSVKTLLVALLSDGVRTLGAIDGLVIATSQATLDLSSADLRAGFTDLKTLVRRGLAPLDAATRTSILECLAQAPSESLPDARARELSESLFGLRQGVRERLPTYGDQNKVFAVTSLMTVDDRSFYVGGWMRDPKADIARLTAVSPEGHRAELADLLFQFPRSRAGRYLAGNHSGADFGFICFFELQAPSFRSAGWVLEMETADGDLLEVPAPSVQDETSAVRAAILNYPFSGQTLGDEFDEMMSKHVSPAISRIQEKARDLVKIESVAQYGTPAGSPGVSIIVPLYERIDLIEHQLAAFADDSEIHGADLIYVLDSPQQSRELLDLAARLFPLYRVPLRIAVLAENVGFAGANNAGASLARGRLLLLLNSDVLPDKPGWLARMCAFHDATPNLGALGAKLLYEDDSIQHAGIHFHQRPGSFIWQDAHYFKGLHRTFPAANVPRPVPVVSGACLMMDRELFKEVGGLRDIYVRGDYEDCDLCLRMMDLGRENWYLPEVELYHLEALSYQSNLRLPANRYNAWLHTHMWKEQIDALMERDRAALNGLLPNRAKDLASAHSDLHVTPTVEPEDSA